MKRAPHPHRPQAWPNALLMVLFVGMWFAAPILQTKAGNSDGAAWVQMFMIPTGLIGLVLCGINMGLKNTPLLIAASVVFAIHCAIGLGIHPK